MLLQTLLLKVQKKLQKRLNLKPLLLIGLGNPGLRYINTRHNAGFLCLDTIARKLNLTFKKPFFKKWEEAVGDGIVLIKPLTYMNRSGQILDSLFNRFNCTEEDMVVLVDQMDLPVGKVRIKKKGSGGTHNGLRSINAFLDSNSYKRVYIGVGEPKGDIIEHVLGDFYEDEFSIMESVYIQLGDALIKKDSTFQEIQNTINSIHAGT